MEDEKTQRMASSPDWTFLSNYGHVLLCIAGTPEVRLRDVAERVGITERAVQRIIADLEEAGYLSRSREGRRNYYKVHADRPLRHSVEAHYDVGLLLSAHPWTARTGEIRENEMRLCSRGRRSRRKPGLAQ